VLPALVDLHVRSSATAGCDLDPELLIVQAKPRGLDAICLTDVDAVPDVEALAAIARAADLTVFFGVELPTELGHLVAFVPTLDPWYHGAGWRGLARHEDGELYSAEAIVAGFEARGGAVIAAHPFDRDLGFKTPGDAVGLLKGLAGVIVVSDPRHTTSNELALKTVGAMGVGYAGGSASGPDVSRFGKAATLFSILPASQEAFVHALRERRFWLVELRDPERRPAREADAPEARQADKPARQPRAARGGGELRFDIRGEARQSPIPAGQAARAPRDEPARARPVQSGTNGSNGGGRPQRGRDEWDNRGNRAPGFERRRGGGNQPNWDEQQPAYDPVARMYDASGGLHDRTKHLTDDEIDRIAGNRADGPDRNTMLDPFHDVPGQNNNRGGGRQAFWAEYEPQRDRGFQDHPTSGGGDRRFGGGGGGGRRFGRR